MSRSERTLLGLCQTHIGANPRRRLVEFHALNVPLFSIPFIYLRRRWHGLILHKCTSNSTPQPTTPNVFCQYMLHTLFTPLAPAPNDTPDGAAAPAQLNTFDRDRINFPVGWGSLPSYDGFDTKASGKP